MSNIDKQWLQQKITEMEEHRDLFPGDLDDDHASVLSAFRIALASLEAEAVGEFYYEKQGGWYQISEGDKVPDNRRIKLYTAPPALVSVPDEMTSKQASRSYCGEVRGYRDGWNACRAAMLQGAGGNYPVIPDGLRLALSNAGIAAPESDELLFATHEKYVQLLVTWVKDRKPFQPLPAAPQQEVKP